MILGNDDFLKERVVIDKINKIKLKCKLAFFLSKYKLKPQFD